MKNLTTFTKTVSLAVMAVVVTSHLSMAEEVQIAAVEETPATVEETVATAPTNEQFAEITLAAMQEVCSLARSNDDRSAIIVLSAKAYGACDGTEKFMPTLIKKGTRFTVARTGSEFNAMIANLDNFKKLAAQ